MKAQTKKATAGEKSGVKVVRIPPPNRKKVIVKIVGLAPLVAHNIDAKNIIGIREKQELRKKETSNTREKRDPMREFEASKYVLQPGKNGKERTGFPAGGIAEAMITTAQRFFGHDKVYLRGCFWIHGEESKGFEVQVNGVKTRFGQRECVEIIGKPEFRSDTVRLSGMSRPLDLRYRVLYEKWSMNVEIEYDGDRIKSEDLVRLLHEAGVKVGIGEGRPEKTEVMGWGKFSVEGTK